MKMSKYREPSEYVLRIDGDDVETSTNVVDLYWKARRAVWNKPDARAEVESLPGCYFVQRSFSDKYLTAQERKILATTDAGSA
jgi:hypothetical protein